MTPRWPGLCSGAVLGQEDLNDMDMLLNWPVLVASVLGSVGIAGAWLYTRHHASAVPARGSRSLQDRGRASASGKGPSGRRPVGTSAEALDTLLDWEPVATRVLTTAEREAYHVLRKALPDHMILGQVPVARFIKVPTKHPYSEWLRRVGSLCADLVVCDMASQVVAVVEVRQPRSKENERAQRRHARMDKVLEAARIPVHVWLEGALPGPVVAREAILGAAIATSGRAGYTDLNLARRDAEAAAVVASLQNPSSSLHGMSTDEMQPDLNLDDWADEGDETERERKEPPPSTWFDDLDSGATPLDAAASEVKTTKPEQTRVH
jgi:hypothetical protein